MMKLAIPILLVLCCQELGALPADLSSSAAVQYHDVSLGDEKPIAKRRQTRLQAGGCTCNANVYDSGNYGGRALLISQQNAHFNNDFFDDRIESVHLHGNCRWLFYEHPNFNGRVHLLRAGYYASAPSWGGSGNQISSARALPPDGTPAIALFQHPHFTGRMLILYSSNDYLPYLEFDDHVSSAIVIGGTWGLYQHPYFQGTLSSLGPGEYASIQSLGPVGDDSLTSVRKF